MSPPPAAIRIRTASIADLAGLAALENAAFAEPWTAAAIAGFWTTPGACGWLAEGPEGVAVGSALFSVVAAAQEAELLRVATAPAWQRRQVATRLLALALADLELRAIACFLEVRADNDPAQRLYRQLGFAQIGRRPGYFRDGCDAWLFARPVADPGPG